MTYDFHLSSRRRIGAAPVVAESSSEKGDTPRLVSLADSRDRANYRFSQGVNFGTSPTLIPHRTGRVLPLRAPARDPEGSNSLGCCSLKQGDVLKV